MWSAFGVFVYAWLNPDHPHIESSQPHHFTHLLSRQWISPTAENQYAFKVDCKITNTNGRNVKHTIEKPMKWRSNIVRKSLSLGHVHVNWANRCVHRWGNGKNDRDVQLSFSSSTIRHALSRSSNSKSQFNYISFSYFPCANYSIRKSVIFCVVKKCGLVIWWFHLQLSDLLGVQV